MTFESSDLLILRASQISLKVSVTGNSSLIPLDNAMYSECIVEVVISVCNLELRVTGTNPVLLLTQVGSSGYSEFHKPAQSASTCNSRLNSSLGVKSKPLFLVPFKYLAILFIACS